MQQPEPTEFRASPRTYEPPPFRSLAVLPWRVCLVVFFAYRKQPRYAKLYWTRSRRNVKERAPLFPDFGYRNRLLECRAVEQRHPAVRRWLDSPRASQSFARLGAITQR